MKTFNRILILLSALAPTCFAAVTVSTPTNGATVNTTFPVSASAPNCSNQAVSEMAFSMDNGADEKRAAAASISGTASSGTGGHILHVKAWGTGGAVCVTDVAITVGSSGVVTHSSVVPANATSVSSLQTLGSWRAAHDAGSGGSSSGGMAITSSPSRSGAARKFSTTYANYGGERYTVSFGDDATAQNFFYDAWIYIAQGSSVANIEMDMNQVMPNGQTVIYGFQCDGWSKTWDYTMNKGTPTAPVDTWVHSGKYCNPAAWGTNAWHHVQISYSRDAYGKVCYKSVWLDGAETDFYNIVPSAFALGWAQTMLTNFQIDGAAKNGGSVVYLDNFIIYRW
jgi:hypothetical protein